MDATHTETYTTYILFYNRYGILTTVTKDPSVVTDWISETETTIRYNNDDRVVIGLDCEWRPSHQLGVENPVAVIQLCIGYRCLVFQIIHSPEVPASLINFLSKPNYTFVGVGIHADIYRLARQYPCLTGGGKLAELGRWTAEIHDDEMMKRAGLERLAKVVLGVELEKPENVRRGDWDNWTLTKQQVEYASIDGFLCYEIARILIAIGGGIFY